MEGVTILNKTEIMWLPIPYYFAIPVSIGMILIGLICCGVLIDEENWWAIMPAAVAILGCCFIVNLATNDPLVPTGRYEYEVLLSEEVSFTELYERYEIVEQRGEIWVLRDKEKEGE